jgi:hypothetical protein
VDLAHVPREATRWCRETAGPEGRRLDRFERVVATRGRDVGA